MPATATATPRPARPAGLRSHRITPGLVARVIRNPLDGLPGAIYHEGVVTVRVAGRTRVYVADPALIGEALVRHAGALRKGHETTRALGPGLGDGLLTADGAHWRWQRRSVAPQFSPSRVAAMLPAMIGAACETRDRWRADGPATLRLGHEMMRTTFAVIVATMFAGSPGLDVGRVERAISTYLEPIGWVLAYSIFGVPSFVPYPGRRRARRASSYLRRTLEAVVAGRRADATRPDDLVSMLLDAADPDGGRRMTDREVVDNLLTFVAAGHETTAVGLAWTLHLLAAHPAAERRCVDEIAAVTGGGPLLPEHVERLDWIRQVFSEAMRLYPPAPIISRDVVERFEIGGHEVPRGATLVVPIHAVHRHRLVWDEPELFRPERFAPEASAARGRYAFMPFGAGPRVCIGNVFAMTEAVAILAVLLGGARLTPVAGARPVEAVMRVTLRPRPDMSMHYAPR